MSLYSATLVTGIILIVFGASLILNFATLKKYLTAFPRSRYATVILMGLAMAWFSHRIYNLGVSDFGNYKMLLMILFLGITTASFYFVPDFLSVRALSGLVLLSADVLLEAAFMQTPTERLFLVTFVYLMIIFVFVIGASPYLMRDLIIWFYNKAIRVKTLAYILLGYGSFLVFVALNY